MATPLTLTGERTLPGLDQENYWFRRHEAAYLALGSFAAGAMVLEAGCGEGYGAELLRRAGCRVVAVDYLPDVVGHVAGRYPLVSAVRGDLQRLPLADRSVEVVSALQVIEHLHDQPGFLAECARVLRPAGSLLLSTPNRLTFSPGLDRPANLFHTRELDAVELVELVAPRFCVTRTWGLRHGARLARWERRHGSLVAAQLARDPAGWSPALRETVRSVRATDFVVAEASAASLDLLLVGWARP